MIDWFKLAFNTLWILGCALGLATLSYASWEAWLKKGRFISQLRSRSIQISLHLAGLLISLGIAGSSYKVWMIALWGALALTFAAQVIQLLRSPSGTPPA